MSVRQNTPDEIRIIELVNAYRAKNKLNTLRLDPFISQIGDYHTITSLNKDKLSHDNVSDRYAQIKDYKAAAENVGKCPAHGDYCQDIVAAWIRSPVHNANLLGQFNTTGLSFHGNGECFFATQLFAWLGEGGPKLQGQEPEPDPNADPPMFGAPPPPVKKGGNSPSPGFGAPPPPIIKKGGDSPSPSFGAPPPPIAKKGGDSSSPSFGAPPSPIAKKAAAAPPPGPPSPVQKAEVSDPAPEKSHRHRHHDKEEKEDISTDDENKVYNQLLLKLINGFRKKYKAKPVELNEKSSKIEFEYCRKMLLGSTPIEGGDHEARFQKVGGFNFGFPFVDCVEGVDSEVLKVMFKNWEEDSMFQKTIKVPFTAVGISVQRKKYTYFVSILLLAQLDLDSDSD